jgi:hypothetical protein
MSSFKDLSKSAIDDERDASGNAVAPKTSGAAKPAPDTSKSAVANRDTGPRKAGATPRPTDKPINDGGRG